LYVAYNTHKPHSHSPKAPTNSSFDKNLAAYMLAAGAAGVSLLAAQTAEAKIVYTPANITIASA